LILWDTRSFGTVYFLSDNDNVKYTVEIVLYSTLEYKYCSSIIIDWCKLKSQMFKLNMKIILNIILLTTFTTSIFSQSQEVVINEFLASNSSINIDSDFNSYSDWLELYNPQSYNVDLSNWFLTDNLSDSTKWQIPTGTLILPGEYLIFWADGIDSTLQNFHTNFKLSQTGEEIGLYNSNNELIDSIVYGNQTVDISFGRQPDDGLVWYFFDSPTPGEPNSTSIFLKVNAPLFSLPAGFYADNQILEISTDDPLVTIRYTINGNEPTVSSLIYSTPITIQSRVGEVNVFSEIETNKDPYEWLPDWEPPSDEVFKANVIRARAFKDGYNPSEIITSTFFVDENIFLRYSTLPVISIVSDYKHLFDYSTGIYVPGVNHVPGRSSSGNYFEDWEKPAHIEYFDISRTLGFSQDVGINVQGGTSPASPQKGLHVIARSEYGKNRISYPIFKNDPSKAKELKEFKRFIIRSWGSLIGGGLLNDAYSHRIMAKNDLDIQGYQPAVVFINGEYWGLHSLREANKFSWYYQDHYNIDRDDPGYDILNHSSKNGFPYANVEEGDAVHWAKMILYIKTNDMSLAENYEHLKSMINMENFITYLGHCMYIAKWDWPNNNDASWRPRTEDGKWKWIQYDMETGLGAATALGAQYAMLGPQLNMVKVVTEGVDIPGFSKYGPHPIVEQIFNNYEFRDSLNNWFDYHLAHEFSPDSMNYLLDEMAAELKPYMEEYINRSPYIGELYDGWENAIEQIREFNNLRPDYMREHLLDITDVDATTFINYSLHQNYPNPFNPVTKIQYSIPIVVASHDLAVKLKVYDVLGREIITLVNEIKQPGNYEVNFDAKNLASGLYFYTINAGEFRDVKKMILLK
jgi:CotH kinase protein/Lamin Tail Domain/Chitobiase/beta-hexosaminidase C-terminal domain/Secretion system C-terminal sorting domain